MTKPNYTRAYLREVVRFLDQKDFTVYEGTRLALLGSICSGSIPSELHPDQVIALHGMNGITVELNDGISQLRMKDAPKFWEGNGREWLLQAWGLEVDKLPEGTTSTPYTSQWLAAPAIFLDLESDEIYRATNQELLGASLVGMDTWRVTPSQVVEDKETTMTLNRGRYQQTYPVVTTTEELRQAGSEIVEISGLGSN